MTTNASTPNPDPTIDPTIDSSYYLTISTATDEQNALASAQAAFDHISSCRKRDIRRGEIPSKLSDEIYESCYQALLKVLDDIDKNTELRRAEFEAHEAAKEIALAEAAAIPTAKGNNAHSAILSEVLEQSAAKHIAREQAITEQAITEQAQDIIINSAAGEHEHLTEIYNGLLATDPTLNSTLVATAAAAAKTAAAAAAKVAAAKTAPNPTPAIFNPNEFTDDEIDRLLDVINSTEPDSRVVIYDDDPHYEEATRLARGEGARPGPETALDVQKAILEMLRAIYNRMV